jgi:hypothetical protein
MARSLRYVIFPSTALPPFHDKRDPCVPTNRTTINNIHTVSGAEDGVPPAGEPAPHPVTPNPFGSSTEIRFSSNR